MGRAVNGSGGHGVGIQLEHGLLHNLEQRLTAFQINLPALVSLLEFCQRSAVVLQLVQQKGGSLESLYVAEPFGILAPLFEWVFCCPRGHGLISSVETLRGQTVSLG